MKISNRSKNVEPSLTRHLFNIAKSMPDVLDLTLGDPDIVPIEDIRNSACKSIMDGKTRYSANAGLLELRESISDVAYNLYGIKYNPENQVIVTIGGMEALFLALSTIIDPGDEVIVHAPYYVNYVQMIRLCGGVPVLIETTEDNNFSFSASQVEKAITSKTVAMIINSPCNPTGRIISADVLDDVAKIAEKYDLFVVSDEVYRTIVFGDNKHESIVTRQGMADRTIIIDSISKHFAMTGYRCGSAIGPSFVIENMVKMQENVAACTPLPSQYAAITAYKNFSDNKDLCSVFEKRCKLMYSELIKCSKLRCLEPVGTFYLFINIEKTRLKSYDFALELLKEKHVAVAPGITYGEAYDDYIRIACTIDSKKLSESAKRIIDFVNSNEFQR